MEVDVKPPPPRERANLEHSNFIDDDDLQVALAKQRRNKLKKTARQKNPEDIAAKIKNLDEIDNQQANGSASGGLEFDDTSEFIRTVQMAPQQEAYESKVKSEPDAELDFSGPTADASGAAEEMDVTVEDVEGIQKQEPEKEEGEEAQPDEAAPETSTQASSGKGLGSILASLKQQGQIEALTPEQRGKEQKQQSNLKFLADQRAREVIREEERMRIRADTSKTQQQRDYENRQREARSAQEDKEAFERNYKPSVDIKYFDETGRSQTTKEAWKYLNYKFHGREQGMKGKEKILKRVENERRQLAMTAGETPLNMMSSFQARQEATGSAHMVLSVGNRGAAPQSDTMFDAGAGLSKGKRKADESGSRSASVSERAVSAGVASVGSNVSGAVNSESAQPPQQKGTSSFVPIGATGTASGAPAEKQTKSSFAPIANAASAGGGGTPNEQGGLKLGGKISFGKRKSEVDDSGRENKQAKLE